MLKIKYLVACGAVATSLPALAQSEVGEHSSFAGFTGVFNTPNAATLQRGMADIGYNNQLDLRGEKYLDGHNYIFSAGLYPGLEVSGMIASSTMHDNLFTRAAKEQQQTRDLSFNLKYQLPFIPTDWVTVAIGAKDIGGAANNYETYYGVASKEWRNFRFSAGMAASDRKTGMMDGAFGSVEWQAFDWFALQLEHDAEAFSAGAKVTIPKAWLYDIGELTLTSKFYSNTDHSEKDTYWGLNFRLPLYEPANTYVVKAAPQPASKAPKTSKAAKTIITANAPSGNKPTAAAPVVTKSTLASSQPVKQVDESASYGLPKALNLSARALKQALITDGFEAVSVGVNSQAHVVVSFENHVFNRNDIDALGLVMGRITEHLTQPNAQFTLQLKNHGMAMLAISGSVSNYQQFLQQGTAPDLTINQGSMAAVPGVAWVGELNANSPYFKPRLTVFPSLATNIATELGVYDYSLAAKANVTVPLWYGAGVSVTAQTELHKTDDFEPGKPFARFAKQDGLTEATFYQTFDLPYGLYNQTHVGFFKNYNDYVGFKNTTGWLSNNGRHKVEANYAYLEYEDYDGYERDYGTVSYRYLWAEKDLSLHVTGGEFFYGDKGVKLETRFWFGDSYIGIYAQDTNVQIAGITLSIPLTPRKDMAPTWYGQVKGDESWRYRIGTQIGESHNRIAAARAEEVSTHINMERTFFNQGRLSGAYIYQHLDRLQAVYEQYKGN
ncbi:MULTISPECIES: YjbH domain-containing protein [unclassified Pseudoalteromonas]|uniref:YjbH domain-containing protein n=1 Tax=unclassified Pseudoalteromonas TaxID=194690 RepID=UPI0030153CDB